MEISATTVHKTKTTRIHYRATLNIITSNSEVKQKSAHYSSKFELLRAPGSWRLQRKNTISATQALANVFNRTGTSEVTPSVGSSSHPGAAYSISSRCFTIHLRSGSKYSVSAPTSSVSLPVNFFRASGQGLLLPIFSISLKGEVEIKRIVKCACHEHWISITYTTRLIFNNYIPLIAFDGCLKQNFEARGTCCWQWEHS